MFAPATTGSGAPVFETLRTGTELTVVVSSVPLIGPTSVLVMLYVSLWRTVPLASGVTTCTTSWTVPEAPAGRAPRFQVTTPPAGAPGADAETNVVLAGTVSRMTTFVASAVPVLEYDSVLVMLRTGADVTVVVSAPPIAGAVSFETIW